MSLSPSSGCPGPTVAEPTTQACSGVGKPKHPVQLYNLLLTSTFLLAPLFCPPPFHPPSLLLHPSPSPPSLPSFLTLPSTMRVRSGKGSGEAPHVSSHCSADVHILHTCHGVSVFHVCACICATHVLQGETCTCTSTPAPCAHIRGSASASGALWSLWLLCDSVLCGLQASGHI